MKPGFNCGQFIYVRDFVPAADGLTGVDRVLRRKGPFCEVQRFLPLVAKREFLHLEQDTRLPVQQDLSSQEKIQNGSVLHKKQKKFDDIIKCLCFLSPWGEGKELVQLLLSEVTSSVINVDPAQEIRKHMEGNVFII